MSYYFRDKPRFSDKLRGKSGDELFQELKQHLDDDTQFKSSSRNTRDPFERHSSFSRGFPFDDQGFGRLGDIRSQLDNLATRHPEFAEHLLGPPWGDAPLHGTLRIRRRGSGSGNSHQGHPDEDARSQVSGSSAASAASGASGVSSHGEPEQMYQHQDILNKIPQYGLRNTVDIGQHHHMDNAEKMNREQRSASAPPENRQQMKEEVNQHQPPQRNQRFISRVDITPQFTQQSDGKEPMAKLQQKQQDQSTTPGQQQKVSQQQANVRHIPIFVEGRDEPIIPKNIDGPTVSARQQSPSSYYSTQFEDCASKFHNTPHFQRPSTFNQHFANRPRDWSPHFQDPFNDVFDHPGVRKTNQPTQAAPLRQSRQQQHQQPQHLYEKRPSQNQYNYSDSQMGQFQSQPAVPTQQPEVPTATTASAGAVQEPKRKIFTPKDPLEKVDLVQKEVDSLIEQIKLWNGNSKTDKQYIYLDEMLTRELIKLDDIETEGKDNVRQARKNAIKSIQNSISLLESKVSPVQPIKESQLMDEQSIDGNETPKMEIVSDYKMSVQENKASAIPLPALSSSPINDLIENNEAPQNQRLSVPTSDEILQLDESLNSVTKVVSQIENSTTELERSKSGDIDAPPNIDESNQISTVTIMVDNEENNAAPKSGKSPKKLRKTKKQLPISTEPIPLPAAENHCLDMK